MLTLVPAGIAMGYRVGAMTKAGGAVSVIVSDAETALAQIANYREDGFTSIIVKTLEGREMQLDELTRDSQTQLPQ